MTAGIKRTLLVLLACAFSGCGSLNHDRIDYSQPENWLSLPAEGRAAHDVDVFYVYPTEYAAAPGGPLFSEINDPNMMAGAQSAFQKQATAFAPIGNIYAPYYRQADASRVLSLPTIDDVYQVVGTTPASDVTAAFDYYIHNYNDGRPFILASHSQGSTVVALLLQNYMKDHPLVYEKMIAAYAIGWSFIQAYFDQNPHLRFADGPDDTRVIISYNTQGPSFVGKNPVIFPGAMAINPITWTRGEEPAAAAQNLGSLRLVAGGQPIMPVQPDLLNYADARVAHIDASTSQIDPASNTEVVLCSTVDPATLATNPVFHEGVYHNYDYPFYYQDIRVNAAHRTERFLRR